MVEQVKTETEVYKELYEKARKDNERLIKLQAAQAQANKNASEPVVPKVATLKTNNSEELNVIRSDMESLKQELNRAIAAVVGQLNNYGTQLSNFSGEQERIRTQARKNYENIANIVNLINGGK